MRAFGVFFLVVGAVMAALSARAISDPDSLIGWERWTDDPWSAGLFIGTGLIAMGLLLLLAKRFVSAATERKVVCLLSAALAGILGFLLFAPAGQTGMCIDTIDGLGSGCRNQDWSTVTGLTFSGDPKPWLGLLVGFTVAIGTWLLIRRRFLFRQNDLIG